MLIAFVALATIILDQLTKFIISANLSPAKTVPIVKNIFHLTLTYNTGAAFGIFKDATAFFIIVAVLAIGGIFSFLIRVKLQPVLLKFAFGLILGGAIGNLIDRIRCGFVIDFLDFRIWPVFNIADSAITIGAGLLILHIARAKK